VSALIGTAGRRLVKSAFRAMGLEISRYAGALPADDASLAVPPNKLSVVPTPGGSAIPRPAPFVLVASNHGTLIVNRNDHSGPGQSGFGVGIQILTNSCFDYDEIKLALTLLCHRMKSRGPGVVAIDCGANLGVHTVEWARQMSGWGSVIAIEAQERIFYSLCGNIAINNCMNARAIWAAAGATSGTMRIPIPDYNKPASFGSLELRERQSPEFIGQEIDYTDDACATVDVVAIDDLQLERLDFLKIDVEGMESEVLSGAERTMSVHKPVMIIEILKSKSSEIMAFLDRHGYRYHRFSNNFLAIHEADPAGTGVSAMAGVLTVKPA
jgi:FkbM family methyltransferase